MSEYGVDLAEWYAAGRWVALLDFIDGLPSASRLNEAKTNDPELAKLLAQHKDSSGDWAPRVSEFGLTQHMLRDVLMKLDTLINVSISAAGGKPGEIKPFPSPKSALPAAIEAAEREWAGEFIQQFGFDPDDL
jgi:hypothetical protein